MCLFFAVLGFYCFVCLKNIKKMTNNKKENGLAFRVLTLW